MLLHQEHKLFIFLFIFLVLFSSINLISARGFDVKDRENVTTTINNITNYFNITNSSNFSEILITDIGNIDNVNDTEFNIVSEILTISNLWLTTFINAWFSTQTTDDLTEGSTNFYNNQSFNQTLTDSLYATTGSGNASWNQTHANTLYLPHTTDTNASTECAGDEVLLGNGSCQSSSGFGGASVGGIWTNDTNEARLITPQDINLQTNDILNVTNITIIDSIKDSDSSSRVYFNVNGTFVVRG